MPNMSIEKIEKALAEAVAGYEGGIEAILDKVYRQVVGGKSSFGTVGDHAAEPWFEPDKIRKITSHSLARARYMMLEAEVHHQCACHYVKFLIDEGLFEVGDLPKRKGPNPEYRVASSWTTMVCNHEIVMFALLRGYNPTFTHSSGIELSTRYYFTENSPAPFMKHEAKIMTALGLWRIEPRREGKEYKCLDGPYLLSYMERVYWRALDWGQKQVDAILVDAEKLADFKD